MLSSRMLVSYSHANAELWADLRDRLRPNLACLSAVRVDLWHDRDLLAGDEFTPEIKRQIDDCDYGLLLLSPAYFASRYIGRHELPRFVGPAADRRSVPVDLDGVVLDGSRDLRGVQRRLVFRHRGRCYRRSRDRDEFASELATQIRRRVLSGR
jgi:hypothetical protein